MVLTLKIIGTGLATMGLIGAGVGMGAVLGTLILVIFRKLIYPKVRFQLSSYALLWFLFFKAAGLFALICLFAFISTLFLSFDQMVFLTSGRWFYLFFPVNLNSGQGAQRITNKRVNGMDIHPSFSTILKDKTRGGVLLSNVILNLHKQNKLDLPLFLTPIGIKASHDLINMLNLLPTNNNSQRW